MLHLAIPSFNSERFLGATLESLRSSAVRHGLEAERIDALLRTLDEARVVCPIPPRPPTAGSATLLSGAVGDARAWSTCVASVVHVRSTRSLVSRPGGASRRWSGRRLGGGGPCARRAVVGFASGQPRAERTAHLSDSTFDYACSFRSIALSTPLRPLWPCS